MAIEVAEDGLFVPIQFLPRLVLNLSLVLGPADKVGDYPMRAPPPYQLEGHFVKKAF